MNRLPRKSLSPEIVYDEAVKYFWWRIYGEGLKRVLWIQNSDINLFS